MLHSFVPSKSPSSFAAVGSSSVTAGAPSIVAANLKPRRVHCASGFSTCRAVGHPRGLGSSSLFLARQQTGSRSLSKPVLFALAAAELKKTSAEASSSLEWQGNIAESFDFGETLGEGQQGIVKEAFCKKTGQKYAVKVMSKKQAKCQAPALKRMKAEALFLAEAQGCPFAVHLVGAYEDNDNIYVVMDCLSGGSLAENLAKTGPLTEQQTAQFMHHIFSFLAHTHSRGVCYGDIKPANFMLTSPVSNGNKNGTTQPVVKAVDFGCCQKVVPGLRFRNKTGTPLYMAPEVHIGNYGVESDVWSSAVMMFQMLSGKVPFVKLDRRGMVRDMGAHVGFSFEGEEWQTISAEAKDLINKLLVRDKKKRLSAKEVLQHPWFASFRPNFASNIISLNKEPVDKKFAELLA